MSQSVEVKRATTREERSRVVALVAIKELAGHRSLRTMMRYMHLGKGEKHRAIQMLEEGRGASPAWRHTVDASGPENTEARNP